MKTVVSALRTVPATVFATLRTMPRTRLLAMIGTAVILVAVVVLVPLPTAVQLRDWATSLGAWFPLAFLAAHMVVTVFPFPRTAFHARSGPAVSGPTSAFRWPVVGEHA
ncbi:MAG: hypothetical protein PGN37_17530 [Mycobacterium kyogaense]|uniref:hypothetical protein n=1 Tax=Mycobacterium kyogaense TaxID=2212479 RepID=UPI002FF9F8A7